MEQVETKSAIIYRYLQHHYPCMDIPFGDLANIGRKFGVTRELVRQQAAKLRIQSTPYSERRTCPDCGGHKSPNVARCVRCKNRDALCNIILDLTCEYCGKLFQRTAYKHKFLRNKHNLIFCSRACGGKVTGKLYGRLNFRNVG